MLHEYVLRSVRCTCLCAEFKRVGFVGWMWKHLLVQSSGLSEQIAHRVLNSHLSQSGHQSLHMWQFFLFFVTLSSKCCLCNLPGRSSHRWPCVSVQTASWRNRVASSLLKIFQWESFFLALVWALLCVYVHCWLLYMQQETFLHCSINLWESYSHSWLHAVIVLMNHQRKSFKRIWREPICKILTIILSMLCSWHMKAH